LAYIFQEKGWNVSSAKSLSLKQTARRRIFETRLEMQINWRFVTDLELAW